MEYVTNRAGDVVGIVTELDHPDHQGVARMIPVVAVPEGGRVGSQPLPGEAVETIEQLRARLAAREAEAAQAAN
jgi:hypothetical protein